MEVQALEVRRLLVEQPSGHYLSPRGRGVCLKPSRLVEYHQAQVEVLELVLAVAESDRPPRRNLSPGGHAPGEGGSGFYRGSGHGALGLCDRPDREGVRLYIELRLGADCVVA